MAEVEQPFPEESVLINASSSNGSDLANVTAAKFVSTPEGTAIAYGSLVFMALLPIFFGALRSVSCAKSKNSSDMPETITSRDAARFPIIASCTLFGLYLFFKHWIANNLFGLAFALNGVELLHLNNVSTGCILLGGLFIYDVFWVFGTNVMVTVAKSFEAPIKLVFPQDLLEKGLEANNFAMLGLGDIVIPGMLVLSFSYLLKKNTRTYFYTSFLAYIFGLGLTIFVMHTFKHAQPALLYLVPSCIGFPVLVALIKGEVTEMFRYEENSAEPLEDATEEKEKKDL
ncbi:HM13 protein, partial [Polypterus senegalus]